MFAASHEVQFVDEKAVAARVRQMQHELERGDIRDDRRPRSEEPFAGSDGPAFEDQALRCRRDVSHWDADKASASRVPIPGNMLHGKTWYPSQPKSVQKQSFSCTAARSVQLTCCIVAFPFQAMAECLRPNPQRMVVR